MRRSSVRLYAPFIALAVIQALFVLLAPSREPGAEVSALDGLSTDGFADAPGAAGGATGVADGRGNAAATGAPVGAAAEGGAPAPASATNAVAGGAGPGQPGGPTSSAATPGDAGEAVAGDTGHCRDGRQHDITYHAPPCVPVFTGDNGGATYAGVSGEEILAVDFSCQPNEQVNAILAPQGLSTTEEERAAMRDAATEVVNERYELYGRTLVWKRIIGDCPLSPPDPAKTRQAAEEVAKLEPFVVYHGSLGPETHDVWARRGIISVGGSNQVATFLNGRRPFRYDVAFDGTQGADIIAEYYCKKLAKGTASHAGTLIHPQIGGRSTPRALGILVPDNGNGATVPNAERVQALVEQCSGRQVPLFTYASDINRAQEQTRAVVAAFIDAKVTTVVCMCDAIAPVFLTNGFTQNSYYPEHVLPGAGSLDFDKLGRLYDPAQWNHAFGPSHLESPVSHDQTDATKVWRAAGREGVPCQACNGLWNYVNLIGTMVHGAGPNLNPLTVERGMLTLAPRGGWEATGGRPEVVLWQFGQDDYTARSDFREVYWDQTAVSAIDNQRGAYVNMDGGRRYRSGELDAGLDVPAKPS